MAKYLGGEYVEEAMKEIRGSRDTVKSFERKGFKIVERDGDLWILKRPAKLIIVLQENGATYSFDMQKDACEFCAKEKITWKVAETFKNALKAGEVQIELYPESHSYEMKQCG